MHSRRELVGPRREILHKKIAPRTLGKAGTNCLKILERASFVQNIIQLSQDLPSVIVYVNGPKALCSYGHNQI